MYILLILIGCILIGLNFKAIKIERKSFSSEMTKASGNTSEIDEKIMMLRSEFGITVTEMQRELKELKDENLNLKKENLSLMAKDKSNDVKKSINEGEKSKIKKNKEENSKKKSNTSRKKENKDKESNKQEEQYIESLLENIENVSDEVEITVKPSSEKKSEKKSQKKSEGDDKSASGKDDNSLKVDEVKKLLSEGINEDEIAQRLAIGKGEVLLIKELYLK